MPKLTVSTGAPCWFELSSTDPDASLAFHHAVFGWEGAGLDMGDMGTYTFLKGAGGTVGALCGMPPGSEGRPSNWSVYFAVANVDASVAQALELGGQLLFGPFDVPEHGRGAVLSDPTGAVFCLWQPASADPGDFVLFEPHAVGWVELATRDGAAARNFYAALLGWSCTDSAVPIPGGGTYTEYAVDGTRYGGLLPMTAEWGDMPSHWSIYVLVADVDATVARVAPAGGKVCVPAFDAPGVGRIARIDDPTGAGVYIIALAAQS